MNPSQKEKLNLIGIDIWRKRFQKDISHNEEGIYLIDENFIFVLGKNDPNELVEDNEYFLKTLIKSIKRNSFKKFSHLESLDLISHIFLFGAELPQFLEEFNNKNISFYPSIAEICRSGEDKKLFFYDFIKQTS